MDGLLYVIIMKDIVCLLLRYLILRLFDIKCYEYLGVSH